MDKGKRQRKKDNTGKRKRGVGIGIKIMGLLLLLAITAISCVGVLVWTLQSVIGMSDQIVSEQVAEQEKISTLSRQFTYINSQVLTHVMTTNSVTMDTLSEKILQDIADMEQQIEEFGALLSEGDERKEALDSASAELAKYRKTVESLLVTSAENKTQAYVSATSNLPMFNESIEACMNEMRDITGEQMDQAYEGMSQRVENIPRIVVGATWILTGAMVLILIGMCTQERFFCQFLCPMGAVFAMIPILPSALFNRNREKCPSKCGLCRKRCPAHLEIDGDTPLSGECICCHACQVTCPRKNIQIGPVKEREMVKE